jgi:hypothetical protein
MSDKNLEPITNESYLIRLKQKGKSDEFCAAKLGWTVEEVRKRWKALVEMAAAPESNGLTELRAVTSVLSQQMQMIGQTAGIFTNALLSTYPVLEFREIIEACPKDQDLAAYLLNRCIVLRPFSLPTPEALAREAETPSQK